MDSSFFNLNMEETTLNLADIGYSDFMSSPPSVNSPMPEEPMEGIATTPAGYSPTDEELFLPADFFEKNFVENFINDQESGLSFLGEDAQSLADDNNLQFLNKYINGTTTLDPAIISPLATMQKPTVVAPVHVQELNTPTTGAPAFPPNPQVPARTNGRRKSGHLIRNNIGSATPEFLTEDVKPVLSTLVTPARGKKRPAASAPSSAVPCTETVVQPASPPATPQPSKKIKKYELNDPNNHSVRNAKAAKANRDKKKQMEAEMKNRITRLETENAELKATLASYVQRLEQKDIELAAERQKVLAGNGINSLKAEILQYLAVVLPPAQDAFGPIRVQMAPSLSEGQVAAINPATLQNVVEPSQILTTHMDFATRTLTYDYDPLFNARRRDQ